MASPIEIKTIQDAADAVRAELRAGGLGAVSRAIREAKLEAFDFALATLQAEEQVVYESGEEA
jgi:hypothetical protein